MRSDWKIVLTATFFLLVIVFASNCAWVIRTREEIDRVPIDLTPLSESLLVLPDSVSNKYDPIINFQIRWRMTYNKPTQPILTYTVDADGKFNVFFEGCAGQKNVDLGYLDHSDIHDLIYALNDISFFNISEERLLYEHFDVERIYLFGILVKTKRRVIQNHPSEVTYHFNYKLKNFNHKGDYYGIRGVTDKQEHIREIQILKDGSGLTEKFFGDRAREFSEKSCFTYNALGYQIVPACSLDMELEFAKKISTYVTIREYKDYTVIIKILVAPDGQVVYGIIQEPSGNRYFDYRALYSIKRYKFTPPKYHGKSVYTWISIPLRSIILSP